MPAPPLLADVQILRMSPRFPVHSQTSRLFYLPIYTFLPLTITALAYCLSLHFVTVQYYTNTVVIITEQTDRNRPSYAVI